MNRAKVIAVFGILFLLTVNCVQPTRQTTVRFEINMQDDDSFDFEMDSVGVIGEYFPLNWNTPIWFSDSNGDSIYTGSVVIDIPYDTMEFKLIKGNGQIELFGKDNRKVGFNDEVRSKTINTRFDDDRIMRW